MRLFLRHWELDSADSRQAEREREREVETVRMDMVMDRVCMAMGVM